MNTPDRPSDPPSDPRVGSPSGPRTDPGRSRGGARIRLLVVDDHPVVRSGIVGMLGGEEDLDVAGQAADGAAAVELAVELAPDVVLMDLRMPGLDGVEATRRILAAPAPPRVVVLTTYDTDGDILRAVEAGAIGYLLKDSPREDILAAVRAAAAGRSALSPTVTTRLVGAARASGRGGASGRGAGTGRDPGAEVPVTLSPREREVLAAVSRPIWPSPGAGPTARSVASSTSPRPPSRRTCCAPSTSSASTRARPPSPRRCAGGCWT